MNMNMKLSVIEGFLVGSMRPEYGAISGPEVKLLASYRHHLPSTIALMAAVAITPAPLRSHEAEKPSVRQFTLTAKEKKYDRQLRLWAASGQQALEEANIVLLNSGSGVVGIETLKNLILPGVGQFTIVDEAKVQESDLGVNFFLEEDSLGKSRAQETCNYLRELNPEVQGFGIREVSGQTVTNISWSILIRARRY